MSCTRLSQIDGGTRGHRLKPRGFSGLELCQIKCRWCSRLTRSTPSRPSSRTVTSTFLQDLTRHTSRQRSTPSKACPDTLQLLKCPPSTPCLQAALDRSPHPSAGKVSLFIPSRVDSGKPTHPHCQATLPCPGFPIT